MAMLDSQDPKYDKRVEEAWAYFMDMQMLENLRQQDRLFIKMMFDAYFELYHSTDKLIKAVHDNGLDTKL